MYVIGPGGIGIDIAIERLAKTITYNSDGNVSTISCTFNGDTYTRTFTYAGGNVSNISYWTYTP